uniref:Hexosyltransferase n=1 Tax=Alexandrium catenella TaxID=2925 RepID=A0A7S1MQG0_ALECA
MGIEENMNNGKTALWFLTALQRFPWATHFGKLDMDTFPFLHKLVHRMAEGRNDACPLGPYEFIGAPDDRHVGNFSVSCPRESCDRFAPQLEVWNHMNGGFYALSRPLAEKLSWEETPRGGGEDCATTWLVIHASWRHGFCVVPRALDSWHHGGKASDPDFANHF